MGRWSRFFLSRSEAARSPGASGDGSDRLFPLVRTTAGSSWIWELSIGDPAEIQARRVKKQKTDRKDAQLLLKLMLEDRFPRIWVPSPQNRDVRQLLWHRHRLVQMRTRIMNQLQALAMNEGYRWKKKLFSEQGREQLEKLALAPWASRRRQELLELLDRLHPMIKELTAAAEQEAKKRPEVARLMTHPGVGPLTALAYVLIVGNPNRFHRGKQIGNYVGMIPSEDSSGGKQRLGHISKQGNSLLRFLLVEAAQAAVRNNADWRRRYLHLAMRRHRSIAKVAMGRRLGSAFVLDVAQWPRVFAVDGVRFVRGTARYRTWCEVNTVHLVGHPAPCKGSSKK